MSADSASYDILWVDENGKINQTLTDKQEDRVIIILVSKSFILANQSQGLSVSL